MQDHQKLEASIKAELQGLQTLASNRSPIRENPLPVRLLNVFRALAARRFENDLKKALARKAAREKEEQQPGEKEDPEPTIRQRLKVWTAKTRKALLYYYRLLRNLPEPPKPFSPPKGFDRLCGEDQQLYRAFEACRDRHRPLSEHYSIQYKGSYLLNYMLAVVAVSLAVLSLSLLYLAGLTEEHTAHWLHGFVIWLGAAKLVCLIVIFGNTRQAAHIDFNQRAITYRLLMEQLRCLSCLSLPGIRRTPGPAAFATINKKFSHTAVEEYLNATVDKLLPAATAGAAHNGDDRRLVSQLEFMQASWIGEQIGYHRIKVERQTYLDKCLERQVNGLNLFVMCVVFLDIAWSLARFLPESIAAFLHGIGTPLILVSAAIVPALVAAFNALRSQTEARKLAERSGAMVEMLTEQRRKYDALIGTVIRHGERFPALRGLFDNRSRNLVNETAQIMIDEVTEWTFIYSNLVFDT